VIWIDVHPTGKTRYTQHVHFYASPHTLHTDSTRTWQPFVSHQQHWMDPTAPKKKCFWYNPQPGWMIRRFTTQFLSQDNHWSSNESQTSVDNMLHWFTGPINKACDWYVQYLLAGVNPSILNRHRHGIQSCMFQLSTSLSPTFPTDSPTIST
jgi:hypothetical protein